DFLELFFGIRIIWIAIRMILQRQLAVGGLQFNFGHGARNAQHLVIIAFCVRGQTNTFRLADFFELTRVSLETRYPSFAPAQGRLWATPHRRFAARGYFPGFFATFTIAGRSRRSLYL